MIPGIVASARVPVSMGGGGPGAPWGGETPNRIILGNFKGTTYAINGSSAVLADVFEENTNWGTYTSSDVVGGTGLSTSAPCLTSGAYSALAPGSTGFVAGYVLKAGTSGIFTSDWFDASYTSDCGFDIRLNHTILYPADLLDSADTFFGVELTGGETLKVVVLYTKTDMAKMLDYESVSQTISGGDVGPGTAIGIRPADDWIVEKANYYQRNADPTLVLLDL